MKKGKEYVVYSLDEIALLVTLYKFIVKVKRKIPPNQEKNYLFYSGAKPSAPDGDYIDKIHHNWFGNYQLLERHHG